MEGNTADYQLDLANFDIRDYGQQNSDANSLFNTHGMSQSTAGTRSQPAQNQTQEANNHDNQQMNYYPPFSNGSAPLNVDDLQMLVYGSNGAQGSHSQNVPQNVQNNQFMNITAETLKERLAQQMKLQQLQQIQNQILQQQIELLSGASLGSSSKTDFHQLLTPANTNIESAPPSTNVSPAVLGPGVFGSSNYMGSMLPPPIPNSSGGANRYMPNHNGLTMSAPSSLAFQTDAPRGHPNTGSPAFLTPLTSPHFPPQPQQSSSSPSSASHRSKRSADAAALEMNDASANGQGRKRSTHSQSTFNTISPSVLSGSSQKRLSVQFDAPSPAELSMPPPAQPYYSQMNRNQNQSSLPTQRATRSSTQSNDIGPVGPSSLMDMSSFALPPGLTPQSDAVNTSLPPLTIHDTDMKTDDSSNATNKRKGATAARTIGGRPRAASSAVPASVNTVATARGRRSATVARNSNGALNANSGPQQPPKKSNHKDAEQRRRDSLKHSFDELRTLLPPIPLSAGSDPDDPPLPGAMPPRGPPKGDGDGPNRAVSKLALLRCGNEYIRDLKGRIDRRDDEISKLRRELARLKLVCANQGISCESLEESPVDIEKDMVAEDERYREERRRQRRIQRIEEESEGLLDAGDDT